MLEVFAPATTANLACGFDVLGLALSLFFKATIRKKDTPGIIIRVCGEGAEFLPQNEENLFVKSMQHLWAEIGFKPDWGLEIVTQNEIPISRGLGSSAACITAALLAANELAGNPLDQRQLLNLAWKIEGHPDNILPAFLGGFTIASTFEGELQFKRCSFLDLEIVACIPGYQLSTREMRRVLPERYPRHEVVSNLSRLAFLVSSVYERDPEGFLQSLKDYIHEPYRGKYIRGFEEVKAYVTKNELGNVTISGSGPTLILFLRQPLTEKDRKNIMEIFQNKGAGEIKFVKMGWTDRGAQVKK